MNADAVRTLITDALRQRGWSQAELARRLGVSQPSVSIMLRTGNPTMKTLARISEALGYKLVISMPPRPSANNHRWLAGILDHVVPLEDRP